MATRPLFKRTKHDALILEYGAKDHFVKYSAHVDNTLDSFRELVL